MSRETLFALPIWYIAFVFSTTWHEAAHALAGKLGGDDTAASQVTLDPIPHIRREPFGMILMPLLSFFATALRAGSPHWMIGWASTPLDPLWASRHPHRAAWMAAAGPASNFVLAAIAAGLIHLFIALGILEPGRLGFESVVASVGDGSHATALFLSVLFSLNVLLGTLNLMPVPPLDGFHAVPLVLTERARQSWYELGTGVGGFVGLLIVWFGFGYVFPPVFIFAIRLLYGI